MTFRSYITKTGTNIINVSNSSSVDGCCDNALGSHKAKGLGLRVISEFSRCENGKHPPQFMAPFQCRPGLGFKGLVVRLHQVGESLAKFPKCPS